MVLKASIFFRGDYPVNFRQIFFPFSFRQISAMDRATVWCWSFVDVELVLAELVLAPYVFLFVDLELVLEYNITQ